MCDVLTRVIAYIVEMGWIRVVRLDSLYCLLHGVYYRCLIQLTPLYKIGYELLLGRPPSKIQRLKSCADPYGRLQH